MVKTRLNFYFTDELVNYVLLLNNGLGDCLHCTNESSNFVPTIDRNKYLTTYTFPNFPQPNSLPFTKSDTLNSDFLMVLLNDCKLVKLFVPETSLKSFCFLNKSASKFPSVG
jgi:hypothetical protein